MEYLYDPNIWATFTLLIGLELVLGIDNIIVISILASKLPVDQQEKARKIGLGLAFIARIILLFGVSWLQTLTTPILYGLNGREIFLLSGGTFLIYKAVKEMHYVVEKFGLEEIHGGASAGTVLSAVILQIVLLDIVFSIDSVITAVGLTDHLVIIIAAVLISFVIVLFFANIISNFVHNNPSIKILALSFLIVIGVTICAEGLGGHIPKGYIYLPMGFGLFVNILQMRFHKKRKLLKE